MKRMPLIERRARIDPIRGLGFGCLAVGALMVLSAAFSELLLVAGRALGVDPTIEATGFAEFQLRHHVDFNLVQAGLGIVTAWVGMAVLRRRAWARLLLEVMTWLGILANLAIGAPFLYSFRDWPEPLYALILTGGLVMIVALTAASLLLIRYLRSATVRGAFMP